MDCPNIRTQKWFWMSRSQASVLQRFRSILGMDNIWRLFYFTEKISVVMGFGLLIPDQSMAT